MSILSIGYSGMNAFQNALSVTANNIANVKTRGYSRQSIQFAPTPTRQFAGSFIGTGVAVNNVYRNADQFANAQVRSTLSIKSQYDTFYQQALQINKLLSQDGSSLSASLQSFFDSLGQLNNSPDNVASRNVVMSQSQLLASQFLFLQQNLDQYQETSTSQIKETANKINQITSNLAAVNAQIMNSPNSPDLLDQRDELLKELSEFSDLTVVEQDNGMVNVGIGSGQMLVIGATQRTLTVNYNHLTGQGTQVLLGTDSDKTEITNQLTSGTLGGLLDYERNILSKSSQIIGQMAIGLAQTFNAQNSLGMDLNNQLGQNIFTDYNTLAMQLDRSFAAATNAGTGVLSINISDISQVKASDYQLVVTNAGANQVTLIRDSDGSAVTLNWTSNPPTPPAGQIVVDGMTITVDNLSNLADNDSFTIMPTRGAAAKFSLLMTDPRQLALASPVQTNASLNNTGQGQIALGPILNTTEVSKQYTIDFISPTQFNLINVTDGITTGPLTFVPNTDNVVQIPDAVNPSYSITLSGAPNAGDQFTAQYNQGGYGDNRNGLLLAGIQQKDIFSNGNETLFDIYSDLLSDTGSQTNEAKNRADAFQVLYKQSVDYQESISGVNLDEEAENLLQFKQAYEAAGKLMEIANQMMNILFEIMR
ncbi:flagellar hook-associated protein FlgK [Fluoribacter dumoffii]|uniref:Flagellar hook-associated protein 1 n=1 Tax=Fluoribacter dumoffii TaxID=463 RepID=A0A377GA81_9GAMM|nr:flagellar hook-associated protein FlgK [Fluoribacter dumoffii]KTC88923.1 flagellar hook-associated protein FlgK [Fluoribacter dumoffii NY 23]MCW8385865.1 flagellar hook-associated protein FlgK [Fluoribacter dumoffii]MCW8418918.1 flagellar hook-associated protein FlgK [Fluoribacter dumoffii]MCW8453238.1 flagellar hook-associated protein FlgK [Fluoribacter dumoffii]MCW8459541.1 flagellar hook-associated protein FlgK [Fluoribacter dumoffii]